MKEGEKGGRGEGGRRGEGVVVVGGGKELGGRGEGMRQCLGHARAEALLLCSVIFKEIPQKQTVSTFVPLISGLRIRSHQTRFLDSVSLCEVGVDSKHIS